MIPIHADGKPHRFRITHTPINVWLSADRESYSDVLTIRTELLRRVDIVSGPGGADFVRCLWLEPVS